MGRRAMGRKATRRKAWIGAGLLAAAMIWTGAAAASPLAVTRLANPVPKSTRILIGTHMLGPMAAIRFCLDNPRQCRVGDADDGDGIELTAQRWEELGVINRTVNHTIAARPDIGADVWSLDVEAGDCDDYAVQKRHALIARGWPMRAVTLAVVKARGEHHLVAVARTDQGDFVLDNLTDRVLPWARTGHRFVMVSAPADLRLWHAVAGSAAPAPRRPRDPAAMEVAAKDTTANETHLKDPVATTNEAAPAAAPASEPATAAAPPMPLTQRLRAELRRPPLARNPMPPALTLVAGHLPAIY